ncbi:hypothetical protein C487_03893 [Natrinema pallidum DSM 3751]|uniref:Uncharacterized protein n=1 Tax=Natrinema pallidum DSM 3751 TaxID=1227495 RepID=L9Z3Q6_9EURY|nr:hypothetical protein C487_03893 [Natrinema pallidum DSM 3751]
MIKQPLRCNENTVDSLEKSLKDRFIYLMGSFLSDDIAVVSSNNRCITGSDSQLRDGRQRVWEVMMDDVGTLCCAMKVSGKRRCKWDRLNDTQA